MLNGTPENNLTLTATDIRLLYNKYSGMLLGFISQIIADKSEAELQMINVFKALANTSTPNNLPISPTVINSWSELRKFALLHLPTSAVQTNIKPLIKHSLTEQEQQVFNIAYYQKQSVAAIATQLNQTEDLIRETLKKAFLVMKQNYGN